MTVTAHQPAVSAKGKAALDEVLAQHVASGKIPAVTFGATTADGPIYFAAKGERVLGEPDKGEIDDKTMLQLYSMTKLVTTIACLQLIDRGLLSLDDAALVDKLAPELVAQPILTAMEGGKAVTQPRTQPITLRRLLTHTSGLGYNFTSPLLAQWQAANPPPAPSSTGPGGVHGKTVEGYTEPLLFEPGTEWKYSIGIDWAGILVERASGMNLEEYFHKHIFAPLGLTKADITFIPTDDIRARIQKVCAYAADGSLKHGTPIHPLELSAETIGQLSGGGGLYGTAKAYLRFLQGILQREGGGIISANGFETLFSNALPERSEAPPGVYKGLAEMTTRQRYHDPEHTANNAQYLAHSVGLVLSLKDSVNGRKKGSGCWDGAAKTQYWLDPATGIAGICFTQLLVEDNRPWTKVYNDFERALYDALE